MNDDGDHDPEPDPDEPVTRWEVTGCVCGRVISRPQRRPPRPPDAWRHVTGGTDSARP